MNSFKLKNANVMDVILRAQRKYGIPTYLVIEQKELYHVIFCNKNLDYPMFQKDISIILSSFMMFLCQITWYDL